MRYSDVPAINAFIAASVADFQRCPLDARGDHAAKTASAIIATAKQLFGDFAASVKITIH